MKTDAATPIAKALRGTGAQLSLNPQVSLTQKNGLAASASIEQTSFPKDRREVMVKTAGTLIELGLKTPEELAARLDKLAPNGALRQYSRAFWRLMSSFDSSLVENPDWQAIYAEMDKAGNHNNHLAADEDDPDEEATKSTEEEDETTTPNGWLEDSVSESDTEDSGSERDGDIDEPRENHDWQSIQRQGQNLRTNKSSHWLILEGGGRVAVVEHQEAISKDEARAANASHRYGRNDPPDMPILSLAELPDLVSRGEKLFDKDSKTPRFSPENVSKCAKELAALRRLKVMPSKYISAFCSYGWIPVTLTCLWLFKDLPVAVIIFATVCCAPLCMGVIVIIITLIENLLTIKQRGENERRTAHCENAVLQVFDFLELVDQKEHELSKLKKERWLALDGWSFERDVAEALQKRGYEVQVTRGSNDGGIDLIITREGRSIIAQCKNYAAPVGPAVVRELYGAMISHGASEAWLIASSGVTAGAMNFTEGKPIRVIDLNEIIQWEAAAQKAGR